MIILACEGPSEVYLLEKLIETKTLVFDAEDILDRRPIHARQPRKLLPLISLLPIDTDFVVFRIGDTLREEFDLSCLGKARMARTKVNKVCTKPEIEILIIIREHLLEEYQKCRSKMSPKEFVKSRVKGFNGISSYLMDHDLVSAIREYKRIKRNEKDELYLADLLKDEAKS